MSLINFFKSKSREENIQRYVSLLNERRKIRRSVEQIRSDISLRKSMPSDNWDTKSLEEKESSLRDFENFNKSQNKVIIDLCNRQIKIEKSLKSILEKEDNIEERKTFLDIKLVDEFKTKYENGEIKKSAYFDIIKATSGIIKYADTLVFNECGQLLVLSRVNDNGSREGVCIPGGHVEIGEDFEDAAKRELFEETNISCDNPIFIGTYHSKKDKADIYYYRVDVCEREIDIILNSSEHCNYQWVDLCDLNKYQFIFNMKENIKKLLHIEDEDKTEAVEIIVKGFAEGWINKEMFDTFVENNHEAIEKAMNKRKFSTKEREELSEKKQALPDGSFPIRNEQDLKDAIKTVGRAKNYEVAKQWIIKRAKELNKLSVLPEDWDVEKAVTMADQGATLAVESLEGKDKNLQKSITFPKEESIMEAPIPEGESTYGMITLNFFSRNRDIVKRFSDFLATLSKVSRCCETFSIEVKTPKNGSEKLELNRKEFGLCGVKVEKNLYKAQDNEIQGGLADGKTCEDIAKKHKVSLESIQEELKRGMEVEKEHTTDEEKAKEIAMDHIWESPTYYQELAKIESEKV